LSNTTSTGTFELSGFFGGEIEVNGNNVNVSSTIITNCDNVIFENWYSESTKDCPALKLLNSKNITFENSTFESFNLADVKCFDINNSSVYINASKFIFSESEISAYFKGRAINNSQVFIDGLCSTCIQDDDTLASLDYFKKFELSDNSMCTWLDDSIPAAKLGLYAQNEFKGISQNLPEDVYIGNHLHQNVPPQFLPPTEPPDDGTGGSGSGSGGSGGSGSGGSNPPGGDSTEDLYTIDNTLPVGATFYWPRAFTIPFTEVSGISGVGALPGSTYFFYPPATEITSDYQKSASSVLIPFMTRSNSFR
jgi:hypothetical protein